MEEDQYRKTYSSFNERRCVYEKAINSRRCTCQSSHRFNLADREGVACQSEQHHQRCQQLIKLMRKNAAFALKLPEADGSPLPHAKELKVQIGGLQGLMELVNAPGTQTEQVENIAGVISSCVEKFGHLEEIPFNEVVKSITSFEGRPHRTRKR